MRTQKTKHKGFLGLNGNTGTVAICLFIATQTISGLLSFGGMKADMNQLNKKIDNIISTVETNRKEARDDIKNLAHEFRTQMLIKRSA